MAAPIKEKHLDLLQGVINRLAGNSFLLKAWSVTLAVAMLAVAAKTPSPWLAAIALLPALAFWGLDGFFLATEKAYRALFEQVIDGDENVPAYSMRVDAMRLGNWLTACRSVTLLGFHGAILTTVITGIVLLALTAAPAIAPTISSAPYSGGQGRHAIPCAEGGRLSSPLEAAL